MAAGTSPPSLLSLFPEVEAATITSIIQHEFRGSDLYKLDSRYRDKTERQMLALNGTTLELTTNDTALKEYKSLNSILVPLSTYFSILIMHAQASGKAATISFNVLRYNGHLVKIASEYEWTAVVAYHMAFFAKRKREMSEGDYGGWGRIDLELQGEHLYPNRKLKVNPSKASTRSPSNATDPCRNFNQGKCTAAKCPWGRPHTCSTCGKADHGAHTHSKTA